MNDRVLLIVAVILAGLIFLMDLNTELGVAGGVPYIIVVLLGLLSKEKRFFIYSGVLGISLTITGFFLSPAGGELYKVLLNRFYAIVAIFVTAFLGNKFIRKQEEFEAAKSEFEKSIHDEVELADFLSRQTPDSDSEKTFHQAMRMCLENICRITHWSLGHLYLVSSDGEKLEPTKIWFIQDPDGFQEFMRITEETSFEKGIGLPGRVAANGKPVFIPDVSMDTNFPRFKLLKEISIRGAFGIPVKIKGEVRAVLEFFSYKKEFPDEKIMRMIEGATDQVSRILERWQNEMALFNEKIEAQKANRAKSLFIANMSHEIRTPMNAVLGYSQILLGKKDLDKETEDAIRTIDSNGKNLLKLLNEVLDISKIEAGKMELVVADFDLNDLIDNLSTLFNLRCREKKVQWAVKGFSGPVRVLGDETKLRQALVNLLGNAIKFTDFGEVQFNVTALVDSQYRFDIIDTGLGIPAEAQDKIFDAFQQDEEGGKRGGTGLGLAIAKKQLELMGADLLFKSEVNKGAHFYFTLHLPPATGEVKKYDAKTESVPHLAQECKVKALVVDDVEDNREMLSALLSYIGVEVIEAENGKEGAEKTIKYQPDIVFMDMLMPVMGGEEAMELIQKEFGADRIKIVAITAAALDFQREYFLDIGCHEYISKPFKAEELYNCLNKLLDVEFVYDDNDISESFSSLEELDQSQLSMPEELYERFKESAQLCNITGLDKNMKELRESNGASKQLIEYLETLINKYDMGAIGELLEAVSKTRK